MNASKNGEFGDKTVIVPIGNELAAIEEVLSRFYKQDDSSLYIKDSVKPLVKEGDILSVQLGNDQYSFYYKSIVKNKSLYNLGVLNLEQIFELFEKTSKTVKNVEAIKLVNHENLCTVATGKTINTLTSTPKISRFSFDIIKSYISGLLCRHLQWAHTRNEFVPTLLNSINTDIFKVNSNRIISERELASHPDFIAIEEYVIEQMRSIQDWLWSIFGHDQWGVYSLDMNEVCIKISRTDFRIKNWMTLHADEYINKKSR